MSEGLPPATNVSKCSRDSRESSCNPCSRCSVRLHVRARERQIVREMFVPKVLLCFAADPNDVTLINALPSAISRHCGDTKKEIEGKAGNKLASLNKLSLENIFVKFRST